MPGSESPALVIVGVVDGGRNPDVAPGDRMRVYVPYTLVNSGVIARTAGSAATLLDGMRSIAMTEAPRMPILRVQTMEERDRAARRSVLRATAAVAAGGTLALILSALGLYAVVAFAVRQRTREIGIRTALGAQSSAVVRMFFAQGLGLTSAGLAIGLPLSVVATRAIASVLQWPLAISPLIGATIGAAVLTVAAIAVWIPARRASAIDPVRALRED
jgi:predicted lysophospholipase L1 biosynthesis ABC-type transport system permease subunit